MPSRPDAATDLLKLCATRRPAAKYAIRGTPRVFSWSFPPSAAGPLQGGRITSQLTYRLQKARRRIHAIRRPDGRLLQTLSRRRR